MMPGMRTEPARLDRYQITLRARVRAFLRHSGMEEVTLSDLSRLLVEFDGSAFVADQAALAGALQALCWYQERDPKDLGQARTWVKPWRKPRRRRCQAQTWPEARPIDQRQMMWDAWDRHAEALGLR